MVGETSKQLAKLYRRTIKYSNNEQAKCLHKQFRNLFNKLKRTAKYDYYKGEFEKHKDNIKKTWQVKNKLQMIHFLS